MASPEAEFRARWFFNELLYDKIATILGVPSREVHACKIGAYPGICLKRFGQRLSDSYVGVPSFRAKGYGIDHYNQRKSAHTFASVRNQFQRLFVLDQLLFNRDRVPHNLLGKFNIPGECVEIGAIDHEDILAGGARPGTQIVDNYAGKFHPTQMSYMVEEPQASVGELNSIAREMKGKVPNEIVRACAEELMQTLVALLGTSMRNILREHASRSLRIYDSRWKFLEEIVNEFCFKYAPLVIAQGLSA